MSEKPRGITPRGKASTGPKASASAAPAPAPAPAAEKPKRKRAASQKKYYRNLHQVPVSFRLSAADGSRYGRRVDLQPRGMRGDVAPVVKGEEDNNIFQMNLNSLFEVITESEASLVTEKQNTNRQAYHPTSALTNENGQPMSVKVEEEQALRSIPAAKLDGQGQMDVITRTGDTTGPAASNAVGTVGNPVPQIPSGREDAGLGF